MFLQGRNHVRPIGQLAGQGARGAEFTQFRETCDPLARFLAGADAARQFFGLGG